MDLFDSAVNKLVQSCCDEYDEYIEYYLKNMILTCQIYQ